MGQTSHTGASKLRLTPIAAAETRQISSVSVGGVRFPWFPSQEVKSLPVRGGKQEQYLHFLLYILHLSFFTILHPKRAFRQEPGRSLRYQKGR